MLSGGARVTAVDGHLFALAPKLPDALEEVRRSIRDPLQSDHWQRRERSLSR